MPARCVSSISRRERSSTTTDSMPAIANRWLSIRPAGPPPTMATVVPVSVRVMPEVSDRPSLVTIEHFC